jgi:hypothetical protein
METDAKKDENILEGSEAVELELHESDVQQKRAVPRKRKKAKGQLVLRKQGKHRKEPHNDTNGEGTSDGLNQELDPLENGTDPEDGSDLERQSPSESNCEAIRGFPMTPGWGARMSRYNNRQDTSDWLKQTTCRAPSAPQQNSLAAPALATTSNKLSCCAKARCFFLESRMSDLPVPSLAVGGTSNTNSKSTEPHSSAAVSLPSSFRTTEPPTKHTSHATNSTAALPSSFHPELSCSTELP